jgi:predicted nucleic acid-binding Zn ribbon protein
VDEDLPRPVAASIDRAAAALGAPRASALHKVFVCWPELVGPAIAAHARPLSLKDGVLTIGVDQPGWATQLRYLEATLLTQLAAAVGEGLVARVELRVVPPR